MDVLGSVHRYRNRCNPKINPLLRRGGRKESPVRKNLGPPLSCYLTDNLIGISAQQNLAARQHDQSPERCLPDYVLDFGSGQLRSIMPVRGAINIAIGAFQIAVIGRFKDKKERRECPPACRMYVLGDAAVNPSQL